ncbi:MAG: TatD family hydrolase [Balneolaceae bacterium]
MVLTDTHCHLYLGKFTEDLQDVLQRAADAGVKHIFLPSIDWNSPDRMDRLAHPEIAFYKMAGIHPCDVAENLPADENRLYNLAADDNMVAVGETGLDYHWSRDYMREQKQSLKIHCRVAKAVKKPVILHNRDSTSDLLDLIESEQDGSLRGIWHCFTGTADEGKRALDLGLYLGIGGVLTFKNSNVDQVVKNLPPDRLLLETDAPFLAPEPKRGRRNEPSYVIHTAKKLAEVTEIPFKELARITTENAARLFGVETQ